MESVEQADQLQRLLFLRTRYLQALAIFDPSFLHLRYALEQEGELLTMLEERLTDAVRTLEVVLAQRAAATVRETR